MLYSKCIIGKIEGKGISTSQCPTCNQPGWKRDLKPVHVLANIAQPISHLLDAGGLRVPIPQSQHGFQTCMLQGCFGAKDWPSSCLSLMP